MTIPLRPVLLLLAAFCCASGAPAPLASNGSAPAGEPVMGGDLRGVSPITDRIVMVELTDAKVTKWPTLGNGSDGEIRYRLVDLERAVRPDSYRITSPDDRAYSHGLRPVRVGRKSKGADFVNTPGGIAWTMRHMLYLELPRPMAPGKSYSFALDGLASTRKAVTMRFRPREVRSETIHINQVGYRPDAPAKYAYLSHWAGDLGPIPLDAYATRTFAVVDAVTGRIVLTGKPRLRKRVGGPPDTSRTEEARNYVGADLWELDFSALRRPGEYYIAVERLGRSFPFRIASDIYRQPYVTTARALYHQRDGVEIEAAHSDHPRPACHHPAKTGTVFRATTARYMDQPHSDGWPEADEHLTGETRAIWGGYHDAGDWDREGGHINVPAHLLMAYEFAPANFRDGDLNIPESGNGIPDIVDEALWGLDFWRRLQRADGGVSVGTFASSWPKTGETCWTDTLKWYVYAEEPAMSYRYAAVAMQAAYVLRTMGMADRARDYSDSAQRAYSWAGRNLREDDEAKVRDDRQRAAAWFFKTLGDTQYQDQFRRDLKVTREGIPLFEWERHDQRFAIYAYLTTDGAKIERDLEAMLRRALLRWADEEFVETAEARGLRNGYRFDTPMWWGAAAHPRVIPLMVAHHLTRDPKYMKPYFTALDFTFGTNPLNMTWVTGLGARSPRQVMNINSWYSAPGKPVPGLLPMGPYRYETGDPPGPWDPRFAAAKTAYPHPRLWPPYELWFEIRQTPATNEYVVESSAEAAAAFGYVAGPAG